MCFLVSFKTDAFNPDQEGEIFVSGFEDDTIRKAFIRKVGMVGSADVQFRMLGVFIVFSIAQVFSVVTIQLLVTFTVVCVFTFSSTVKTAVQRNFWMYLSSYLVFVVVATCIGFFSTCSRTHPWNLMGLVSLYSYVIIHRIR